MRKLLIQSLLCCRWLCLLCIGPLATATQLKAADLSASDILPSTTVIYIEARDTETLLQLPLVRSLTGTELFKQIWRSPDVMKARGGITLAELALGERLTETLSRATSGGWILAVDAHSEGAVLLAQTADKETCNQLYSKLEALASQDAQNNNREFEKTTYRGAAAYKLGNVLVAGLDKWLLVTNKSDLAKQLADNLASAPSRSLSSSEQFKQTRDKHQRSTAGGSDQLLAWAYIDLEHIRAKGIAKGLFKRPDDNFAAELLFGGALSVLRHTPILSGSLHASDRQLRLELTAPTPRAVKSSDYQFYFGPELKGVAPAPVQLEQPHATLTAYRDVTKLWRHAGDLFGQSVNDQLAQAETTLTTLFSGRDFAEEILGAIQPEVQLVFAPFESEYAEDSLPKIKLPAFALVTQLKDAEKMRPQLKRIFMSLVGFINIAGAQNQQPQLDIDLPATSKDETLITTRFVTEADRPKNWSVPLQFNFTPTLLIKGNQAILASNYSLAQQIIKHASTSGLGEKSPAGDANTQLQIDGPLVLQSLAANRDQLISQNMLEKGHTQEEAATEIDTLLSILGLFQNLDIRFGAHEQTSLKVDLNFK